MVFKTGDSERVRIDSVGNMGIGGAPLPPSTGYNGATLHLYQSAGTGGSVLRMTNGTQVTPHQMVSIWGTGRTVIFISTINNGDFTYSCW